MSKETREEIIQRLKKEGYYLTDYAINNMADNIILDNERRRASNAVDDKEKLQTLSAIRQTLEILNRHKLTYEINYLLEGYTQNTSLAELNRRITNLQNKIIKSLKPVKR